MKHLQCLLILSALVLSCGSPDRATAPGTRKNSVYTEENGLALASLSVINMREEPDYAAELGTQALMGTPVKVLGRDDSYWVHIETPDGYKAWVNEMAIVNIDRERLDEWKASRRVVVTNYYSFFLDEPSPGANHVSDAVWGDVAEYAGVSGAYTEVKLPDGRQAYIPSTDVQDFRTWAESRMAVVRPGASQSEVENARQLVIETAMKFLGVPYLWAGTSIKGVDCSGFSKTVYFLNGYMLLRNASQQCMTGEQIDVSEGLGKLQPADLVFFGRKATKDKPERITHVAIYLGDGRIIHSSQVVRINSLIEGRPDYYDREPLRACRIIGSQNSGKGVESINGSSVYF